MPALMEREAAAVDAAELLFDDILAQPCTRQIDRARGIEATPVSLRDSEVLEAPSIFVWPPIFGSIWN